MITQERLKELLHYCPETGVFTWLKTNQNHQKLVGKEAGSINYKGYRKIQIDKKIYPAHKLVWLYLYGEFPEEMLDHINNNRSDNRLVNLRHCSISQNACNRRKGTNNKSGHKNVYFRPDTGKWHVEIRKNKKRYRAGCYQSIEEAAKIAQQLRDELHKDYSNHD